MSEENGHSVNMVGCLKVGKMDLGDQMITWSSKSSCLTSRLNEDGASWRLSYLRSLVKMSSGKIQDLCFMLSSHLASCCSLLSTVWNKRFRGKVQKMDSIYIMLFLSCQPLKAITSTGHTTTHYLLIMQSHTDGQGSVSCPRFGLSLGLNHWSLVEGQPASEP